MKNDFGRYAAWFSTDELLRLEAVLAEPTPAALRLNPLKLDPSAAMPLLAERYGWRIEPVSFCREGWQLFEHLTPPSHTPEFKMGLYYIQDAASMLPAELFSFGEDDHILDMAAAPGGKTTHLISKVQDKGLIIANDSAAHRLAGLRYNIQTWGASNTLIFHAKGEQLGGLFPELFDKVLLDAPCSGETLIPERGRDKFAWHERDALQKRQIDLLISALQALKVGGQLVYSTCTLAPEENEAVLDALLGCYSDQVEIVSTGLKGFASGLPHFENHTYHPQVEGAVRVYPLHMRTSGFFAALLHKKGSVPTSPLTRSGNRGKVPSPSPHFAKITHQTQATYGFDMRAWMETANLVLCQQGNVLYAIPEKAFAFIETATFYSMGLMVGQMMDDQFVPAQELVSRFRSQFRDHWLTLPPDLAKIWLDGRELRDMSLNYPNGSILLMQDEARAFIGRGKIVGKRLRNLMPR